MKKPWLNEKPLGECKSCHWVTPSRDIPYCSEKCREIDELLSNVVYVPSNRPTTYKLAIDMSPEEYRTYKRTYGSCMDEDRNYFGGVLDAM